MDSSRLLDTVNSCDNAAESGGDKFQRGPTTGRPGGDADHRQQRRGIDGGKLVGTVNSRDSAAESGGNEFPTGANHG